jgi:hypothetical protein
MRDAFQNILNTGLRDGDDVLIRMRRLVDALERISTEPSPAEETAGETAAEGSAAAAGGAVATQPSPPASTADVAEPSQATPVPETPASSQSDTGEDAKELSKDLTEAVTKVMGMLSNNPFNLWAGEGIANKSINRVRWQLSARLQKFTDDTELLNDVRTRAQAAATTQNEDQAVWTEVRDTLQGTPADEARTIIQSIIDSFDIDIPVSNRPLPGPATPYSTYNSPADQHAAVGNILASPGNDVKGLADEVLSMTTDPLPEDFDALIGKMESWLRRFLRPSTVQTTITSGHRTVGAQT